jgi:hypothetical protein
VLSATWILDDASMHAWSWYQIARFSFALRLKSKLRMSTPSEFVLLVGGKLSLGLLS